MLFTEPVSFIHCFLTFPFLALSHTYTVDEVSVGYLLFMDVVARLIGPGSYSRV